MILFVRSSIRYNYQIHPYITQTILVNQYCDKNIREKPKKNEEFCTKRPIYVPVEIPDPPTTCCMTGCPNCVWMEYAEKLTKIFRDGGETAQKEIMSKVTDTNMQAYLAMELRNLKAQSESNSTEK